MRNFIPSTPADNAVNELTTVIKQSKPNEVALAKAIVDNGFGNIQQFATDALERILAHKHKVIDPDEESLFGDTQEVNVYDVEKELKQLVEEYTQRTK